jgi:hypothetical protein
MSTCDVVIGEIKKILIDCSTKKDEFGLWTRIYYAWRNFDETVQYRLT